MKACTIRCTVVDINMLNTWPNKSCMPRRWQHSSAGNFYLTKERCLWDNDNGQWCTIAHLLQCSQNWLAALSTSIRKDSFTGLQSHRQLLFIGTTELPCRSCHPCWIVISTQTQLMDADQVAAPLSAVCSLNMHRVQEAYKCHITMPSVAYR